MLVVEHGNQKSVFTNALAWQDGSRLHDNSIEWTADVLSDFNPLHLAVDLDPGDLNTRPTLQLRSTPRYV